MVVTKQPKKPKSYEDIRSERMHKKIAKMERKAFSAIDFFDEGELIHVSKKLYDRITKKVDITLHHVESGFPSKLVIQYKTKGGGAGTLELYDIGPGPQ